MPVIKSNDMAKLVEFDNRSNEIATVMEDILPHSEIEDDGFEFQKCWIMDTYRNKVYDKECLYEKRCVACVWPKKPVLRLRGLCPTSKIEDHYTPVIWFNYHGVIGNIA